MRLFAPLGFLLIATGEVLSLFHLLPWSRYVFPLLWYGYLLVADALNLRCHGRSLIANRRPEFFLMLPLSALYWYLFEWYNAVIQNWHYINTPPEKWIEIPMKIVSFATVIPALYETADLIGRPAWAKGGSRTRAPIPQKQRGAPAWLLVLGIALSLLPLVLPRLFFWSVWLGFFFLLDPINGRAGRPSLLNDWQRGDLGRTTVLLAAGYICGFFWEFWNYWAYTKWIYTIPIPSMPRIFEMPVLGFLGFGPFALETFAFWTFVWGMRERISLNGAIGPSRAS